MALILQEQIGHLLNYSALASTVKVTTDTIISWVNTLKDFDYCYTIAPWSNNISRSLIKQPKVYLWNWSEIKEKNNIPWFLVEVKSSAKNSISSSLYLMHKQLQTKHAFQVCFNSPYIEKNCFEYSVPVIAPASTFLSQLV